MFPAAWLSGFRFPTVFFSTGGFAAPALGAGDRRQRWRRRCPWARRERTRPEGESGCLMRGAQLRAGRRRSSAALPAGASRAPTRAGAFLDGGFAGIGPAPCRACELSCQAVLDDCDREGAPGSVEARKPCLARMTLPCGGCLTTSSAAQRQGRAAGPASQPGFREAGQSRGRRASGIAAANGVLATVEAAPSAPGRVPGCPRGERQLDGRRESNGMNPADALLDEAGHPCAASDSLHIVRHPAPTVVNAAAGGATRPIKRRLGAGRSPRPRRRL